MAGERDNLKAGVFVLAGVTLAVVVIFVLGWSGFKGLFEDNQDVRVYYSLLDGLQGLTEGASVSLGDVPLGAVTDIEDYEDPPESGRVVGKIVTFHLPARYKLAWDARIELIVPLLGSATTLNIRQVGQAGHYAPDAPMPEDQRKHTPYATEAPIGLAEVWVPEPLPDGAIPGTIASTLTRNLISSTLRSIGYERKQSEQVKQIIDDMHAFTGQLRTMPETISTQVNNLGTGASTVIEHMDATVLDVQKLIQTVQVRSDNWMDRLDSITETTDEGLAAVKRLLDEQLASLDKTLNVVHGMIERMDRQTLPEVDRLVGTANAAMDDAGEIAVTARDLMAGQRPVLERTLANLHLSSEQIKLTAIEVRRSPWRLLSKPGKTQLETDNLYDSARSFAQAASSVEAAISSIQSLADVHPTAFERLKSQLDNLQKVEGRFQEAEERFWQHLKGVEGNWGAGSE